MKKKNLFTLLFAVALLPAGLALVGCDKPKDEKIQLDMSNAAWKYEGNFEYDERNPEYFTVEIEGLPEEVSVSYTGNREYMSGDYTAAATLNYDEERYELVNNNLSLTLDWKIYSKFFLYDVFSYDSDYTGNHNAVWFSTSNRVLIDYIHFVNYLDSEAIEQTQSNSLNIHGKSSPNYMWGSTKDGEYHIYIGFNPDRALNIKLPKDCSYYFDYMQNLKGIDGWEYVDTSYVTNMKAMFRNTNLSLSLNFDTSNVTNMEQMFYNYGANDKNTELSLDLGDNFDTSKVENMTHMFGYCANDESQTSFYLDIGDKFFVNSATDMRGAFMYCGKHSTQNWNITIRGTLDDDCVLTGVFSNIKPNTTIYVAEQSTYDILVAAGNGLPTTSTIEKLQ